MEYIAKKRQETVASVFPDVFEFEITKEAKTPTGETVTVIDRVISHTLSDLESKKSILEKELADINAKIDAINKIKK